MGSIDTIKPFSTFLAVLSIKRKIPGTLTIEPGAAIMRSKYAPSVLCSLPNPLMFGSPLDAHMDNIFLNKNQKDKKRTLVSPVM